ncbi:alpha/beta fold hydrolase [Bradyrhizobium sp. AZCC 1721]|uniref:alpha/beta fold hydrolase n=1 Tax=Bradyrhizobium sp. AZCC 1721 TaxID=3117016 RepID=UPI002FEE8D19
MKSPTLVAAVVIRAALSVCILAAVCNLAVADPVARTTNAVATVAPDTPPAAAQPQARVYLFRGALGPIFSRGMDRLTNRLQQAGIRADVYEFTICRLIADQAIRDFRDDPAPIVLIGHSMGGLCALTFAGILKSENIQVSLVVTIDPAQASPKVPLNVERYINIFLSDSILGGGDVVAEQGYQGHYASFDLKQHGEVTHINIDKMDSIHEQVVTAIAQLAATPAKGEAVPLRYVVPPDAPLELWDSGTQQLARSGDTLQRLAALNHVPLWSLTQANQHSDSAPLSVGQRVLVPRRLAPPVATSAASPVATPAATRRKR